MPGFNLLDPNKPGKIAEELKNKLCSLIIGQNEALDQIVDVCQMCLVGLTTPGRPIGNYRLVPARLEQWRRRQRHW